MLRHARIPTGQSLTMAPRGHTAGDRPLRIAFLSPYVFRLARGIERFTISLAVELAALGQRVDLLAWSGGLQPALDSRVRVQRVPAVRYFQSRWAVPFYVQALLRGHYDLVNVFFAGFGEAEAIRWARRARPFAVTFIAGYPFEDSPHRFHEFVTSGLSRQLSRVIVNAAFMAPAIEQALGLPVTTIPYGVNVDYFDPAAIDPAGVRARLGIPDDASLLLTVAALEARKGIGSVIAALPALLRAQPDAHYVVLGEGRDRPQFERQITELGLHGRVHLLGVQADVRPFYRAADIFLLPSHGEGLPNALLEAMAMQLPVVVSQHPPYDQVVYPEFGLCVDERDPAALAAAIAGLCANPARRRRMGDAARARACEVYAWPMVAQRYLEVFRACVAERA